ncbi:hypothetical protein HY417_00815 [Candidatus Kaiserbacteria bacterium]|nr:hypothetical protein [Candidatus Kaiserbacteria bacterium]
MKKFSPSPYLSVGTLLLALLLWSGVLYFARTISAAAERHRADLAGMEQQTAEQATTLRFHALARETKDDRSHLDALSSFDLAEILDAIEALARDAGLPVEITQAPSITSSESSPIRTASFSIEAQGTFAEVARVVALLETMPIPSSLDEVRLERVAGEASTARRAWRAITTVRFLTTADIPAL